MPKPPPPRMHSRPQRMLRRFISKRSVIRTLVPEALEGEVGELYIVGDGQKIGNAMTSIESAYDVAMKIE